MSKTFIVGDIHLKASNILEKADALLLNDSSIGRVVFLGDYCDEWNATEDDAMRELEELVEWVEYRREDGLKVDLLFGNHDFQYLIGLPGPGTLDDLYSYVRETLFPLRLKAAVEVDGFLVTHAGVTQAWADEYLDDPKTAKEAAIQINEMLVEELGMLNNLFTCGPERGGHELPGPLWADKWELEQDPALEFPQIVGHTPTPSCERAQLVGMREDEAPEIWFADTFSLFSDMRPIGDGSVLVVEDSRVSVIHTS